MTELILGSVTWSSLPADRPQAIALADDNLGKPVTAPCAPAMYATHSVRPAFSAFGRTSAPRAQMYSNVGVETSVVDASPHKLVALLFDGFFDAIGQARAALAAHQSEAKGQAIGRAHRRRGSQGQPRPEGRRCTGGRPGRPVCLRGHATDARQFEERHQRARRMPSSDATLARGLVVDRAASRPCSRLTATAVQGHAV